MGVCMACGRHLHRARVEVTTIGDQVPQFIDGVWDGCCGGPVAECAPLVHAMEGPSVPTPMDILRGAGLA